MPDQPPLSDTRLVPVPVVRDLPLDAGVGDLVCCRGLYKVLTKDGWLLVLPYEPSRDLP
jgi:hypothetical protein